MLIVLFLVSHFNFLFVPCGGLSWLPVSFLLHVKYALSYRIVSKPDTVDQSVRTARTSAHHWYTILYHSSRPTSRLRCGRVETSALVFVIGDSVINDILVLVSDGREQVHADIQSRLSHAAARSLERLPSVARTDATRVSQ